MLRKLAQREGFDGTKQHVGARAGVLYTVAEAHCGNEYT